MFFAGHTFASISRTDLAGGAKSAGHAENAYGGQNKGEFTELSCRTRPRTPAAHVSAADSFRNHEWKRAHRDTCELRVEKGPAWGRASGRPNV